jgi:RecB family endonuclease NucS
LRSHVIIEIKNDEFKHEHIGQLEVYLQYYKYEEMKQYDNQPIGILLCTKSKKAMVKYATTAKENVFVNEYLINLPSKSELEKIVKKWMKNN